MGGNIKKSLVIMFLIAVSIPLGLIAFQARGEVTSCQTNEQGTITSCTEFASSKSIPPSMEKICTSGTSKGNKWVKNPCPRAGAIGYCEVPRNDKIIQVVYCYKRHGMPDKQKLGFCKQTCKGRFAPY
jgi:hypothetical protein